MNFKEKVLQTINKKNSAVCVGLDIDLERIPKILNKEKNPILKFNKEIIEATKDHVAAYKPNMAFYEAYGKKGIEAFEKTLDMIPSDIIVIADAKRGDIGNTSKRYFYSIFKHYKCDAITINPYMGEDSVLPFLEDETKGVFILALTSNKGSLDFQMQKLQNGKYLYQEVIAKVMDWNKNSNCGLVVGATHPQMFYDIRQIAPNIPFLIPGIGAQGGDLENTIKYGFVKETKLSLINSSRGIIYASNQADFAMAAKKETKKLQENINQIFQNI